MIGLLLGLALGVPPALADDDAQVEAGQALYRGQCVACHGPLGDGDGVAARALPRPPPDLTAESFWDGMTEERLRATIAAGLPGGVKPPFQLSPEQMDAMIAYLNTMRP